METARNEVVFISRAIREQDGGLIEMFDPEKVSRRKSRAVGIQTAADKAETSGKQDRPEQNKKETQPRKLTVAERWEQALKEVAAQ